jgi:hypothetical protein
MQNTNKSVTVIIVSDITWRGYKYRQKHLPQVTDKLYHIMLYQLHLAYNCVGRCKSNYYIMRIICVTYIYKVSEDFFLFDILLLFKK